MTASRGVPALSDLSATEFVTLSRLGLMPRGLVIGVSVYDTGYNPGIFRMNITTREIPEIGQAMHAARALAVGRMWEQARDLGAEGVIGVRLDVDRHVWRGGQIVARFVALGTAVAFDAERAPVALKYAPSLRLSRGPFTSDLSAHDFALLLRAGFRPVSLAMGNCVWQLATRVFGALQLDNVELADYTQAFAEARESAMDSLVSDLTHRFPPQSPDAIAGVVGMSVQETTHGGGTNMVEFTAIGTAVTHASPQDPRRGASLPAPRLVVPLDG